MFKGNKGILNHPLLRKYMSLVHEDLAETYSRDLHKWLIVAPIIGIVAGLITTAIAIIILNKVWPPLLHTFILHHWRIIPVMLGGFIVTGLIMQYLTPDPNEHSTEEMIRSYHEHNGHVNMRPFIPKLLAAITTVGFGGSAALEGPSIYGGGALGSWLWAKLRRLKLQPRDRRIMLISGAAAGMAAVFRAPLTGLVFALEMPYKDDLAHEALVPSLIASVVSYITLISFMGSKPLFDFGGGTSFTRKDLVWSAVLGVICGLVVMTFDITFRRFRSFMVRLPIPHWLKLAAGGLLTGICGLVFISLYPGTLIPLGPNYEAVGDILTRPHSPGQLVIFGFLKLGATLATLGVGGVSAMFVPLFLTGGAFGKAFAISIVHSSAADLFTAVGMAAFIAGGYKTPLTAVVFVAEATGGHAYIIPTLIGAAVAYAVSGEASVSGDQHLHEGVKTQQLQHIPVSEVMQKQIIMVSASSTLREFADSVRIHHRHAIFPVFEEDDLLGTISIWSLGKIDPQKWTTTCVRELTDQETAQVPPDCDLMEVLRLLTTQKRYHMVLVVDGAEGKLAGVVTKTDILNALSMRVINGGHPNKT